MEMEYGWSVLGTTAGVTAAVLLIVQYCKVPLDRLWKIPTRALVYVLSALLMLGVQAFGVGSITWGDVPLIALNAFVAALASMGAYEQTFAKLTPLDS